MICKNPSWLCNLGTSQARSLIHSQDDLASQCRNLKIYCISYRILSALENTKISRSLMGKVSKLAKMTGIGRQQIARDTQEMLTLDLELILASLTFIF